MRDLTKRRYPKTFEGESRTRQSEAGETDVNKIVARHARTGVVTHLNHRPALYGDVSQAFDLQAALELRNAAMQGFLDLPSAVRKAADNDPVRLLEMLASPEGTAELKAAGLKVGEDADRDLAPGKLPFERRPAAAAADSGGKPPPTTPTTDESGSTPSA